MNCTRLHSRLVVLDVLNYWRETIPIFLRHRMACIGCPMAAFETLEGAAAVYGFDLDRFLSELQEVIPGNEEE